MKNKYIIRTHYFNHPWTWFKRFLEFLVVVVFLVWAWMQESEYGTAYTWIKYLLFSLVTLYIFSRPKDELAVDDNSLYYIKRSILPIFNRTTTYKISTIRSIRAGGLFSDKTEIFGIIASGINRNKVEIIFKDNSSVSHDVTIYKKELVKIVLEVRALMV